MTTYPSPRALLERYGLRAKKSWGQNFLGDDVILSDIARLAAPRTGDLVVELGAGLGHLTARLVARGARVVAVERDREMAAVLRGELGEQIQLVEADAARLDYGEIVETYATGRGRGRGPGPQLRPRPRLRLRPGDADEVEDQVEDQDQVQVAPQPKLSVVGNLPYHLTSPILFSLLDQVERVARAVFLVQREVAERLAASPGSKDWGILSVLLQREADVSIERIVPPGAFLPPPKVESAVVCAIFRPPADAVANLERFRKLVKAGFGQRRKTLGNALRSGRLVPPEALADAFVRAGIDPSRRGETLSVSEWAALDRAL